jgi:hypothetical protein
VRLGWRGRVETLSGWLMADRRPAGWMQWAEVVPRDPVKARFIGDMPHAWVASDFVRATLDRIAYDDEARQALVLGAGVPVAWLDAGQVVGVRGLRTRYGTLTCSMRWVGEDLTVEVDAGLDVPPGGVVLALPFPVGAATVNGQAVAAEAARQVGTPPSGELVVRRLPAEVVLRRRPAGEAR